MTYIEMAYTDGPTEQPWQAMTDGDGGWIVCRADYWQRNRLLPVSAPIEAIWSLENERAAHELAKRLNQLDALAAWQCVSCGARFAQSVRSEMLSGVTHCSMCAEAMALTARCVDLQERLAIATEQLRTTKATRRPTP